MRRISGSDGSVGLVEEASELEGVVDAACGKDGLLLVLLVGEGLHPLVLKLRGLVLRYVGFLSLRGPSEEVFRIAGAMEWKGWLMGIRKAIMGALRCSDERAADLIATS